MDLVTLAIALKIDYKNDVHFYDLVDWYKTDYGLNTARRKALEDLIVKRISALVDMIEDKGE